VDMSGYFKAGRKASPSPTPLQRDKLIDRQATPPPRHYIQIMQMTTAASHSYPVYFHLTGPLHLGCPSWQTQISARTGRDDVSR